MAASNPNPQPRSVVLLNDFKQQWEIVGPKALSAIERVGKSGWLILGSEVLAFEQAMGKEIGFSNVVGCANGLDAIEISLRALGIKSGDRVLTTPLSAFATTLAIVRAGGLPEFVDVDESGLIDLNLVDRFLSENRDVRYMVPVHLFGHPINLKKLKQLKDRYNLKIVEDCAQAIGASSEGMPVGSVGEMAATSFYPTKNLGCMGDGGAIYTHHADLAAFSRSLRDYGQSEKYRHQELGLNSRLDEIQAAILLDAFLPTLASATETRRRIASRYLKEIQHPAISIPPASQGSVWHLFPVLVEGARDEFQKHLLERGIQNGIHYPITIPNQPALSQLSARSYPNSEDFSKREVSLPIHSLLNEIEISRVIEACNSWKQT